MPNRLIKESICTSEDIAALSMGAEILFYRLIVKADDYGAYFGNAQIIKNTCFPLKSNEIKLSQVQTWINELAEAGLIYYYTAEDGKNYVQLAKWGKHQQIRAKKSKFPLFDSTCKQMIADDCNSSRNPIQSNPIRESNPIRSRQAAQCDCVFFDELWSMYPKKRGKNAITKTAIREINEAGFKIVKKAIQVYLQEVDGRDMQYIKNGSTFFNGAWKDYVEETPKQKEPEKPQREPKTIAATDLANGELPLPGDTVTRINRVGSTISYVWKEKDTRRISPDETVLEYLIQNDQ